MIDDSDCKVARAFDVAQRFGGVKHTTFLIDPLGTIRRVYPKVKAKGHAAIVLRDCREIWA
jgi:peroxiredoxin Q/BCP